VLFVAAGAVWGRPPPPPPPATLAADGLVNNPGQA
jgi:hypothetical protein